MANNVNVKKLEADLWESADLLRAGSKLTSNQYCMPVLGLIFLRYAYSRFKLVEQEMLKSTKWSIFYQIALRTILSNISHNSHPKPV